MIVDEDVEYKKCPACSEFLSLTEINNLYCYGCIKCNIFTSPITNINKVSIYWKAFIDKLEENKCAIGC